MGPAVYEKDAQIWLCVNVISPDMLPLPLENKSSNLLLWSCRNEAHFSSGEAFWILCYTLKHVTICIKVWCRDVQKFVVKFFFVGHICRTCPILGPLVVPLFWISGDMSSEFQSQRGFCLICIVEANVLYIPWDPPLVLHIADLLTNSIAGRQPDSYLAQGYYGHQCPKVIDSINRIKAIELVVYTRLIGVPSDIENFRTITFGHVLSVSVSLV